MASPDGDQVGLIGADGRAYLSGDNGWEAFDLLAAGLEDRNNPAQRQAVADNNSTGYEDGASRDLEGHTYQVWSVAFTLDGKLLASASDDQTARLWDLPGTSPPVRAATFEQGGAFCLTSGTVAWACRDQESDAWRPGSSRTFTFVEAMGYRPDGTLVALRKDSVTRVYSGFFDPIPEDLPEGVEFRNLAFLDDDQGWIFGTEGLILETVDGGESWTEARRAAGEILSSLHIDPAGGGWIAGDRQGRRFVLHKQDLTGNGPWR